MAKLIDYLANIETKDKTFVGTIALKNEELTLPNGSKAALGIDGGHWVLVYQEKAGSAFKVFEYVQSEKKIILDKKACGAEEYASFKKLIKYFFSHAGTGDLVTILPPHFEEKT